jgi:hypothetical protein
MQHHPACSSAIDRRPNHSQCIGWRCCPGADHCCHSGIIGGVGAALTIVAAVMVVAQPWQVQAVVAMVVV